jgi:hypothetical protein
MYHLSNLLPDLFRARITRLLIIHSVLIIVLFEGSTVLLKVRSVIPTRRQSQIKLEYVAARRREGRTQGQ